MYVHICIELYTLSYECPLSVLICVCRCCSGFRPFPSISEWFALNEDGEQIYFKQKEPRTETNTQNPLLRPRTFSHLCGLKLLTMTAGILLFLMKSFKVVLFLVNWGLVTDDCSVLLHSTLMYSNKLFNTVEYFTVLRCTLQYSNVLYSTLMYFTVHQLFFAVL